MGPRGIHTHALALGSLGRRLATCRRAGKCWTESRCKKGYGMVSRWRFQSAFASRVLCRRVWTGAARSTYVSLVHQSRYRSIADLDPVINLNILIGRVEMKSLGFIAVLHLMTAWQLHIKLHLGRTHACIAGKVAQYVGAASIHNFLTPCSSGAIVPVNTASGSNTHGASWVGTGAGRIGPFFE